MPGREWEREGGMERERQREGVWEWVVRGERIQRERGLKRIQNDV